MTDAHAHVSCGDPSIREFLVGRDFFGTHPWDAAEYDEGSLVAALEANPAAGVGEIGLDRLRDRNVSDRMRNVFIAQLRVAAMFGRPVVLHGAKCWGDVVKTIQGTFPKGSKTPPSFLFHGFSRSGGLVGDIAKLNGFVSIGPSILNDHAVNYRRLAAEIPGRMLLVETDRTKAGEGPSVAEVMAELARVRGVGMAELEAQTDENARVFFEGRGNGNI